MVDDTELYIGLMSGTSMDAIDAALVQFSDQAIQPLGFYSLPLNSATRTQILSLQSPIENEIEITARLDRQLGYLFAQAAQELLNKCRVNSNRIIAIGSHGQTIRHNPLGKTGYSLQIGDPNTIAHCTRITTVADFRRRDIAAGGEGAPLVPLFHQAAFGNQDETIVVVNIGGFANITILSPNQSLRGFDTGPGNVLLDAWINQQRNKSFDQDGQWATSGKANIPFLEQLLADDYFARTAPKSTGREYFNLLWLQQHLQQTKFSLAPEDVQATLTLLTARSLATAIKENAPETREVYLCGGGTCNTYLQQLIRTELPGISLHSSAVLGIEPKEVEAVAFAWLARQTILRLPGNCPSVTGAAKETILGGIYPA